MRKHYKFLYIELMILFLICIFNNIYADEKKNMAYLYEGNIKDFIRYVDSTNNSVDVVLVNFFNITENGTVEFNYIIDKNFVKIMHDKNIKVFGYISNHWNRQLARKALVNYKKYALGVNNIVDEYRLDGVNIDIENLTEKDKDMLVLFTKYMRSVLSDKVELSMAIAANPDDTKTGWQGSYDYNELDKYLDDFVLMTYDESYYGSKPGPVASNNFIENSINVLLKYTSSNKIVLGIPLYGRYWNIDSDIGGFYVKNKEVPNIASLYNGKYYYNNITKSPYMKFNVNSFNSLMSFKDSKFKHGSYIMYYENNTSIKEKLKFVTKYNLKGTSCWALSQECRAMWRDYRLWLNGNYFEDLGDSFAKKEINMAFIKGYVKGKNIYRYYPKGYMTRREFATIVFRMCGFSNIIINESVFKDIYKTSLLYNNINTLYLQKIIKGYNDFFNPNQFITKKEVITVLYRLLERNNINFSLNDEINKMQKLVSILFNSSSDEFITREEVAYIIIKIDNKYFVQYTTN